MIDVHDSRVMVKDCDGLRYGAALGRRFRLRDMATYLASRLCIDQMNNLDPSLIIARKHSYLT